tara:strand:- start:273 stop:419 length:147 start_codon:yes stop_codon:yes gene_type:complete
MRPLKKIDDILKSGRLHKVVKIALGGKKKNVKNKKIKTQTSNETSGND